MHSLGLWAKLNLNFRRQDKKRIPQYTVYYERNNFEPYTSNLKKAPSGTRNIRVNVRLFSLCRFSFYINYRAMDCCSTADNLPPLPLRATENWPSGLLVASRHVQ